nr:hypothetical protein [Tanacetum cinerariifolium]
MSKILKPICIGNLENSHLEMVNHWNRITQEPSIVDDDDEMSKDKEIDKLMALISLSFKKIYKPINNNLRTSSNTSRANQDNSPRINKNAGYESQRSDDTDDESDNQELEAHYMYMAKIQEVSPDAIDSGPIFETEPEQKVQNDDHYDVFAIECQHPDQSESIHKTYLIEQDAHNVIIDSVDMNYDSEQIDQNDEDADLAKERELLASLIKKLKCEIDESKNRNKFLETSNKVLIDKLKSEIEDFKNKNKSLELSNNQFKEANNKLSEEYNLLYADFEKSQAELKQRDSIEYASEMELECAKVRGDFLSYKMESQKSCNKYTQTINDLNQTISKMKHMLSAHQDTISILSKQNEAQIKLYKTRKDKELEKVNELENKVKVLDNIVYKTSQSVQTMNMLNNKCRTSFAKPEFLKKAKRANPRLYDIGCYNDNLALMLAPESDEVICLEKESRSKLSDLIKPFDYTKLNSLYDLFVPQREKSSEQREQIDQNDDDDDLVNERDSQQAATKNRGKAIVNSPQPIYDQEPFMVAEDDETSKDKEIDKLMAIISLSGVGYDNQRLGNVTGARETVGSTVVQKSRIQFYNCKELRHVARECQKPKKGEGCSLSHGKMLLCKQEEAEIQLNAEEAD